MATKKRYYSPPDPSGTTLKGLKRLSRASQRGYLLHWFHSNFEDPRSRTNYAENDNPSGPDYRFDLDGLFDARDGLWAEFGGIVSETLIDSVVEEVQQGGFMKWAPTGELLKRLLRVDDDAEKDRTYDEAEEPEWIQSSGVISAPLRAGEAVGKPLAEPAHLTPRHPRGIKNSDLKAADPAIQRETALWWFQINFEPYDLSRFGGPWSGYGQGGGYGSGQYGAGRYAPTPLEAPHILDKEFAGVLPDEMIVELGAILAGEWMWRQPRAIAPPGSGSPLTALAPVLGRLSDSLKNLELSPTYGGIGHNNPPDAIPLTEMERAEIVAELDEAKVEAELGGDNASLRVARAWWKIGPKLAKLADWTLDRLNDFFTEASKEAGKTVGKWGPHYLWLHLLIGIGSLSLMAAHLIQLLPP